MSETTAPTPARSTRIAADPGAPSEAPAPTDTAPGVPSRAATSNGSAAAPPSSRPLRADAQRNYDALLDAAAAAFTRDGVDAPLEEIARQAGVGIGTLYRHFPQRSALVAGVYRHEVEVLADAAPTLLAEHDPDEALALWMQRFVGYIATKRGLAAALRAQNATDEALFAYVHDRIRTALSMLLDAATAAGRIRPGVDREDLMRAIGGVCMATDDGWQDRTRRIIGLLMDGLRYGAPNAVARSAD